MAVPSELRIVTVEQTERLEAVIVRKGVDGGRTNAKGSYD